MWETKRFRPPYKSATSDYIGPTTYTPAQDKPLYKNKAPFLKSAKRDASYLNPSLCKSLIYGYKDDTKDTKFGIWAYAERDFGYKKWTAGEHDVKDIRCVSAFDNKDKKPLKKLYVCKTPYSAVEPPIPSVPTRLQKNGYYYKRDGFVDLVPPADIDNTVGPAKYGSNMKKSMYDQIYRGKKFSEVKRFPPEPKTPGPGDYNVGDLDFHRDVKGEEIREVKRLMTFLPRFVEGHQLKLKRENFPGPGQYDIAKKLCKLSPPLHQVPFPVRTKRWKDEALTPGPADYDIEIPTYPLSKIDAPFSNTADRWKKDQLYLAGPGDYDIKSSLQEMLRKGLYYATRQPPFGQGAERVTMDIPDLPGVGDYTLYPKKEEKKKLTSVFKSKTNRWPEKTGKLKNYLNLRNAYDFIYNHNSHNVGKIPFFSESKRKGYFDMNTVPPSTKYTIMTKLPSKGYYLPTAPRFPEDPRTKNPGPGDYLIHPLHTASMHNAYRTFNLKLKQNVLRMEFKCHPRDTWPIWARELKKKKKMRWFLNEGKSYVHCMKKDLKEYKI